MANEFALYAAIVCLVINAGLSWWHARWFDRKRQEWIESNDRLLAALQERTVTNSQEGDEVH